MPEKSNICAANIFCVVANKAKNKCVQWSELEKGHWFRIDDGGINHRLFSTHIPFKTGNPLLILIYQCISSTDKLSRADTLKMNSVKQSFF